MNWLFVSITMFFSKALWTSRALCLLYGVFAHAMWTSKDPEMTAAFHGLIILGTAASGALAAGMIYKFDLYQNAKHRDAAHQWYGKPDDPKEEKHAL